MLTLLVNLPKETLVQQIKDGGILLVLGMGTVFIFLVILIYATKFMSSVVKKLEPQEEVKPQNTSRNKKAETSAKKNDDAALAAAIAAAYDRER
ncbi:MAG TPA: OadG family protein [Candidatus Ornithospirochaeta avicola]|uniref:OadG family protein n=1 Tax=Candidatus Ornithospirochaeta avicola TaxID=2840896 RepID=A0A9D1PTJ0_9SPIO|nr:OadG family protein [Candidatus Ornithospirochaeta avicola]